MTDSSAHSSSSAAAVSSVAAPTSIELSATPPLPIADDPLVGRSVDAFNWAISNHTNRYFFCWIYFYCHRLFHRFLFKSSRRNNKKYCCKQRIWWSVLSTHHCINTEVVISYCLYFGLVHYERFICFFFFFTAAVVNGYCQSGVDNSELLTTFNVPNIVVFFGQSFWLRFLFEWLTIGFSLAQSKYKARQDISP